MHRQCDCSCVPFDGQLETRHWIDRVVNRMFDAKAGVLRIGQSDGRAVVCDAENDLPRAVVGADGLQVTFRQLLFKLKSGCFALSGRLYVSSLQTLCNENSFRFK